MQLINERVCVCFFFLKKSFQRLDTKNEQKNT